MIERRSLPRRRPHASVCLLAVIATLLAAMPARAQTTVVVLVRHAEQERNGGQDPGLTEAGRARADSLVRALRGSGITAIYHTQLRRTRDTAAPVAGQLGITTTELGIRSGQTPAQHAAEVAAHVLEHHRAGAVLVVGHSNTVPLIAAALGVLDAPPIAETEFHHLFVVLKPESGAAKLILGRYGS
jgi:broad specificity phosphatase PhoE